jgi:4-amino-4-deoxy-L-arabinose transferase-like glycosyltransferase
LNSFNDRATILGRKTRRTGEARLKIKKLHIPWPVAVCALLVFVLTNLLSYFLFDHIPHVHDEIDYLFQAKIFKLGRLSVPSPPAKEFFDFPHIINNGRWYSQYTPGYPFLLLLGFVMGAPWMLNPFLASCSIVLFYFLGKEIFNKTVGLFTSLLGAISIWFLLMSSTMMSHTSCMFFLALFLLFLFRSLRNPSVANGICAALALGMGFLIRPYTSFLISLPLLVFYTVNQSLKLKSTVKNLAAFTLTMILVLSVLMAYNTATNGDPFLMGYIVCYGKEVLPGFGISGCYDFIHTPYQGALNTGI